MAPTEIDIYQTKSWDHDALVQPASRAAYARLIKQGCTDAIRQLHGNQRLYTFWHYRRNRWQRDAGPRLDHLLVSPALAPNLSDGGVDRLERGKSGASDHAPVWITLTRNSPEHHVRRSLGPTGPAPPQGVTRQPGGRTLSSSMRHCYAQVEAFVGVCGVQLPPPLGGQPWVCSGPASAQGFAGCQLPIRLATSC